GCDALVLRGRAAEPVWVDIRPGRTDIHSARGLWGLDAHRTTEALTGFDPPPGPSRVLCIGAAGENRVRFAAVMNDRNRAYGRGGPGAVWGSKNLKAVRVSGGEKTEPADRALFQSGRAQALHLLRAAPATKRLFKEMGTAGLVNLINLIDMLPRRNFGGTAHEESDVERVSGEAVSRLLLERAGACFSCPIACQRHTRIGDRRGEGPEYETVVMLGPDCDIYDLQAVTRANYLCNEQGLDTISFGGTMACAMELAEEGLISTADTEGLDLRFGKASVLEALADLTARRRGAGDRLAEGSWRLAASAGRPELSMTVKKMEIPGYDPRASFTQALGYMTSPSGACHLRGGYAVSLAFFGGAKEIPRFSLLQSPIAIRNMQNAGIVQDSLGVCRFTGFAFSMDPWARMMSGLTGLDFSTARLDEIANRVAALERLFNLGAGVSASDDLLPERFGREPITVSGRERALPLPQQERMRADYYQARGWDDAGRPLPGTLRSLGLEER
ncbi:MAG: aldehyde ferredoxin oxidoreductase, partial [Candidatus Aminicenantes bacterium]|nr:aldehyde ferredoxin oxidoreductase [Candidatus Aminicenantes bacterium]